MITFELGILTQRLKSAQCKKTEEGREGKGGRKEGREERRKEGKKEGGQRHIGM